MTLSGGPVFWILLALAAAAAAVFIDRFVELRRAQIDWQDFVKGVLNVLDSGNEDEALAICEDARLPVASVAATAIRHRKSSFSALKDAVDAQGRSEIDRLDRRLASLYIIGEIAPLLGLLGALTGFIKTVVAAAEVNVTASDLMNTAMEGLVPAAMGIAIAIPAAIMHASLRNRIDRIVTDLEAAATAIVGHMAGAADRPAQERGA